MHAKPQIRAFHGRDDYASFALGTAGEADSSFAQTDVYVGSRGLAATVIPDIDESSFRIACDSSEVADFISESLLGNRDIWNQPNLAMELQQYVEELVRHGETFIRLGFERTKVSDLLDLTSAAWLPPETLVHRKNGSTEVYEQYVSKNACGGYGEPFEKESSEFLAELPADEVFHLRWPFNQENGASPAATAMKIGKAVNVHSNHSLLAARSSVEADTFLTLAKARAGAYADALEKQQVASARIRDSLFYPGSVEAPAYGWAPEITDYFAAQRIIRSRISILRLRDYLFREFNGQVLGRWCQLNEWPSAKLELKAEFFLEADWQLLERELNEAVATLDDVQAAVEAEAESSLRFGRLANQ